MHLKKLLNQLVTQNFWNLRDYFVVLVYTLYTLKDGEDMAAIIELEYILLFQFNGGDV